MVADASALPVDVFQELIQSLGPFFVKLSVIAGGIFGLYILVLVLRAYYERRIMKTLQDIRYDFDQLNMHYGIPSSRSKQRLLKRIAAAFKSLFQRKEKAELPETEKKKRKK